MVGRPRAAQALGWTYEIILAENGSKDRTIEIGHELAQKYADPTTARSRSSAWASRTTARPQAGHLARRGESSSSATRSTSAMSTFTAARSTSSRRRGGLVIGSKLLAGAEDDRPVIRHVASIAYSGCSALLGFRGTDTHGLKAFRRLALIDIVRAMLGLPRPLQSWIGVIRPFESRPALRRRYGTVFRTNDVIMGKMFHIADRELIEQMFKWKPAEYNVGEPRQVMEPVTGPSSILLLDGDRHMRMRKLMLPPFHGEAIAHYAALIEQITNREIDSWRPGERSRRELSPR